MPFPSPEEDAAHAPCFTGRRRARPHLRYNDSTNAFLSSIEYRARFGCT